MEKLNSRLASCQRALSTLDEILGTPSMKFWQRNYYERVIRNEREYEAVWEYIDHNPANWLEDENYIENGAS